MKSNKAGYDVICVLFCLGIFSLGYLVPRTSFYTVFFIYTALFIFYVYLYQSAGSVISVRKLLFLAVLVRLLLSVSLPQWSDDYVRFVWDGYLWSQGQNPYLLKPSEFIDMWPQGDSFLEQLYPKLNSPDFHSVYPPSNQLVFAFAVGMAGEDLVQAAMAMRLVLVGFEILVFFMMVQILGILSIPRKRVLLYAINPLVIMEVTGNLHLEGMMFSFILAGLLLLIRKNYVLSGSSFGAAVAVKLTPLMLFPAFVRYLPRKAIWEFLLGGLLLAATGFLPLFGSSFPGFFESLGLYASRFEFNASVYYLLRQLGYWTHGYNVIAFLGPFLKFIALVLILYVSLRMKPADTKSLLINILTVYWIYFLSSTVIHPWYIIPAFGVSIFTGHKAFLVWTYLIVLSYHAYQQEPYEEKTWMLMAAYLGLLLALTADYKGWWGKILCR